MACQKTWSVLSGNTATPSCMPCNPGMTVSCPNTSTYSQAWRVCKRPVLHWHPLLGQQLFPLQLFLHVLGGPHPLTAPRSRAQRQGQASLTAGLEVRGGEPCTSSQKTDLTHSDSPSILGSHLLCGLRLQPLHFLDPVLGGPLPRALACLVDLSTS